MIRISDCPQYFPDDFDEHERGDSLLNSIFVLNRDEAADVWRSNFGMTSKHLFDLEKGSWIDRSHWRTVGAHVTAESLRGGLQKTDPEAVSAILAKESSWSSDEALLFVMGPHRIMLLPFCAFLRFSATLLGIADDLPYLVSYNSPRSPAFRFTPIGFIQAAIRE